MTDRVFEIDQPAGEQIADRLLEVVDDPVTLGAGGRINSSTSELYDKATSLVAQVRRHAAPVGADDSPLMLQALLWNRI